MKKFACSAVRVASIAGTLLYLGFKFGIDIWAYIAVSLTAIAWGLTNYYEGLRYNRW